MVLKMLVAMPVLFKKQFLKNYNVGTEKKRLVNEKAWNSSLLQISGSI